MTAVSLARADEAQIKLSGATLYNSFSDGTWSPSDFWNTLGPDFPWDLYFFTGPVDAPNFLNSGDTSDSLNPNFTLSPGTNVIQFAGATGFGLASYVGLNLYFNDDLVTNRISVVVPTDGTGRFSVIPSGVTTFGEYGNQAGAASTSFTISNWSAQLTDFHIISKNMDLVSGGFTGPDGGPDVVGSFSLVVVPIEPPRMTIEVSQIRLCWNSAPNVAYQIQYRSELTTNIWVNYQAPVIANSTNTCVSDVVANVRTFYRVVTVP